MSVPFVSAPFSVLVNDVIAASLKSLSMIDADADRSVPLIKSVSVSSPSTNWSSMTSINISN